MVDFNKKRKEAPIEAPMNTTITPSAEATQPEQEVVIERNASKQTATEPKAKSKAANVEYIRLHCVPNQIRSTSIGGFVWHGEDPITTPSGQIFYPPTQEQLAELYKRPGMQVLVGIKA